MKNRFRGHYRHRYDDVKKKKKIMLIMCRDLIANHWDLNFGYGNAVGKIWPLNSRAQVFFN